MKSVIGNLSEKLGSFFRKSKTHKVIGLAIVLSLLGGLGVYAAVPHSTTGVITTCWRDTLLVKTFRVIDAEGGATCAAGESQLTWNASGPSTEDKFGASTLSGTDFSGKDLSNMHLGYRDLTGYNFANAKMYNTTLSGSNLSGVNMSGLKGKLSFDEANLSGANLSESNIQLESTGANFSGADFSDANELHLTFYDADLSNASFADAGSSSPLSLWVYDSNMTNVSFDGTKIESINVKNTDLSGAVFTNIDYVYGMGFEDVNMTGVTFTNINGGTDFFVLLKNVDLTNADLTGTYLGGFAQQVEDVNWDNTTCSDGTNSDNNGNTCEGHLIP